MHILQGELTGSSAQAPVAESQASMALSLCSCFSFLNSPRFCKMFAWLLLLMFLLHLYPAMDKARVLSKNKTE